MSVRSWTVGVVSSAAVVAGVVGVQSGIAGTAALPVLPHRAVDVPDGGGELPAPTEVGAPPPSVGTVRTAPADRIVVVVQVRRAAPAHRPEKRSGHSGEGSQDNSGKGSEGHSDKHGDHESGHAAGESGGKSGKD